MNIKKNTPIAICLVGIAAVILYQIVFNLILPISMLIFDLYILKILLKDFENIEEISGFNLLENRVDSTTVKDDLLVKSIEYSLQEEENKPK